MKDRILELPAPVRHLAVIVLGGVLGWLSTDVVGPLSDQPQYGVPAAGVLSMLIAYFTPLVASYGVGADRAKALGARTPRG